MCQSAASSSSYGRRRILFFLLQYFILLFIRAYIIGYIFIYILLPGGHRWMLMCLCDIGSQVEKTIDFVDMSTTIPSI